MNKITVGILFGGFSSEYEVSLMSSHAVLSNIDRNTFDVVMIGITKEGKMFLYEGDIDAIKSDEWHLNNSTPCVISPDRSHHGIVVLKAKENEIKVIRLDVVFPVLHGKHCEDGTMQGLLEVAGIPFVGCGTLSSAACMDKEVTHTLLENAGITTADWRCVRLHAYKKNPTEFLDRIDEAFGFPCFVKPANAGSSVGITKAHSREELIAAIDLAFEHDEKIIVEELLTGIEIECAVIGNDEPHASCLGEIEPCNEFYDYDAKYLAGKTKTYAPARITEKETEAIRAIAVKAFRVMGCRGLARVDFFLSPSGKPILNELNTIPGFTPISMYPALLIEGGMSYSEIISRLILLAMEPRHVRK